MTTYIVTDPAEAQAIGLCWLSRQPGLPEIHSLRSAVSQLHTEPCGWCGYPLGELLRMIDPLNVSEYADKAWWALSGKARLRAIERAQGKAQAGTSPAEGA